MISGILEKNRRLLDDLNRNRKGPFSIKEAAEILHIPIGKVRLLLSYFCRNGWLSRIKRGLYITVPLGTVNPQEYKENPWIVADRVFAPCYIGGWSAAEHWEFTDQIFNSVVIFSAQKVRHKNTTIKNTSYIVKFINQDSFGKTKSTWVDNTKIFVSDPSQTVADILNDPSLGGGMRHITEIVMAYFESEHRDDIALYECINTARNRTIYKRLGYLIETLNIDAADLKEKCRKNISKGYSLLDSTANARGIFSRRWNLRINVNISK